MPHQFAVAVVGHAQCLHKTRLGVDVSVYFLRRKVGCGLGDNNVDAVAAAVLYLELTFIYVISVLLCLHFVHTFFYLVEVHVSGSVSRSIYHGAMVGCELHVAVGHAGSRSGLHVELCRSPHWRPYLHVVHIPVVDPLGIGAVRTESHAEEVRREIVGKRILERSPLEAAVLVVESRYLLPCLAVIRRHLCREIVDVGLFAVAQLQIEAQISVRAVGSVQHSCHKRLVVVLQRRPAVCSRRVDKTILVVVDRPLRLCASVLLCLCPLVLMQRPVVEVVEERQHACVGHVHVERSALRRLRTVLLHSRYGVGIVAVVGHLVVVVHVLHELRVELLAVAIYVESHYGVLRCGAYHAC